MQPVPGWWHSLRGITPARLEALRREVMRRGVSPNDRNEVERILRAQWLEYLPPLKAEKPQIPC
jgi:hypothetical protein